MGSALEGGECVCPVGEGSELWARWPVTLTDYQVVNTLSNHSRIELAYVAAIQGRVECTLMGQKTVVEERSRSDGWREQQEHQTRKRQQHP